MLTNDLHETVAKDKFIFGLVATFLCGMGFSIVMPVTPFLVQQYTTSASDQATMVTLLMSTYAFCMFFSAPILGTLSDRYGRRPILLISLVGSSIGFLIFGLGGSIGILFLGRVIEGLTGGSISTIFAYFADITPENQRTKYFGWISAVAGFGSAIGPALGGFLATFGYAVPLFFGALVSFINFLVGYFIMKESHPLENRSQELTFRDINPMLKLKQVLAIKKIRHLLMIGFFLWVPNSALQSIMSQFSIDTFQLKAAAIGFIFSIIGIQDILSQTFIMPILLKRLSDQQLIKLGISCQLVGYSLMTVSALLPQLSYFIVGMLVFGFGESIFSPSFNGLLSKSATQNSQGTIQGGSQSIQALSRIVGPLMAGQLYVTFGHSVPIILGVVLSLVGLLFMVNTK
ncbi:MFS transporter [Vagococcus hydrophili]|uniref:MFS transporter n=1 Tax=Vagococcus hydrophili TaxID=2714947 RepID=A0A6G8ASY2_9ENTE|nr:MFS transporter [Vagococcus hydrophili]QIL48174.1 MFS transporter [Vagococcus hydrophili]